MANKKDVASTENQKPKTCTQQEARNHRRPQPRGGGAEVIQFVGVDGHCIRWRSVALLFRVAPHWCRERARLSANWARLGNSIATEQGSGLLLRWRGAEKESRCCRAWRILQCMGTRRICPLRFARSFHHVSVPIPFEVQVFFFFFFQVGVHQWNFCFSSGVCCECRMWEVMCRRWWRWIGGSSKHILLYSWNSVEFRKLGGDGALS